MEMGSFIELQFPKEKEYYSGIKNIARLNSGRAAIYHAFRHTGCDTVWLPFYQCGTVREFLGRKGVKIKYYRIDEIFEPVGLMPKENEAVVLVNYFGIMSAGRMERLARKYRHAIIDNSQAFFCEPVTDCFNVYSARKFVGVPDGAYVLGDSAERFTDEYPQGFSSDTSLFLLERIEYGCEGKTYEARTVNEQRIDSEDIMLMSGLTRTILDGTDYRYIKSCRKENFSAACGLLDSVNLFKPSDFTDSATVPMVYPFMAENDRLLPTLLEHKHFQGHWWKYLTEEMPCESFEYRLSRYMIPITIDQRYSGDDIKGIADIISSVI